MNAWASGVNVVALLFKPYDIDGTNSLTSILNDDGVNVAAPTVNPFDYPADALLAPLFV